jgi:hypothetical protein
MPRPNTGEVTEWLWKDGRTITFGARIHVSGSRYRLTFGTSHEGWDRTQAETELGGSCRKSMPAFGSRR